MDWISMVINPTTFITKAIITNGHFKVVHVYTLIIACSHALLALKYPNDALIETEILLPSLTTMVMLCLPCEGCHVYV